MSEWISVNEKLPPEDEQVLCFIAEEVGSWQQVMSHHNSFFVDDFHDCLVVTHWQPLPEPPK